MKLRIRIFKNENKSSDNHPDLRLLATDEATGDEFQGGVWKGIDKNGNPIYTGDLTKREDIF